MSTKTLLLTTVIAFGVAFTGTQAFANKKKHDGKHESHVKQEVCLDDKNQKIEGVDSEKACLAQHGKWVEQEVKTETKKEIK